MVERTVRVTLSANMQQYIAGMEKARKATRDTGTEAEKLGQKKQSFDLLGRSGIAMGVALGAGLSVAVSKAADFNQAMSYVDAATHETSDNMALLRDAAIDAGASTVFSATESANAIEELGKAGLSTADILNGALQGSLSLAAAGGLGVAEAAASMSTALKQFGLEGVDSSHVADLLAAGAGKAMGDVSDLSQALSQAGLVANGTGLSIEETTGTLAAFADAGLLGSDAGTSLKTMLQRLTPQSAEAKKEMDRLGISAYDASGQFIGISKFAGVLQGALADLTPEQRNSSQAIIFGADAVRASNVLYEEGATGIKKYIDQTNDAGYAADTAARRLDNLKGDVEQLGGAFDTALIQSGSQANDALRILTQTATNAVDAFNDSPEALQATALGLTGIGTAASIGAGAFFLGVPKVAEFRAALDDLGPGAQRASRVIGGLTKGLGGLAAFGTAIALLQTWQEAVEDAAVSGAELSNAILTASSAQDVLTSTLTNTNSTAFPDYKPFVSDIDDLREGLKLARMNGDDVLGWLSDQTMPDAAQLHDFTDGWSKLGKELGSSFAGGQSDKVIGFFDELSEKLPDDEILELIKLSPELTDALTQAASSAHLAADDQTLLGIALGDIKIGSSGASTALDGMSSVASSASTSVDDLVASIRGYGSATAELADANSELYQSIDDAREAFGADGFAATLDLTTQAGRDNSKMLRDIAAAANDAAAETYESTMSQEELRAKLDEGRQALFDQARQFFDTDQAAWDYINSLSMTPEEITTSVQLNGVTAAQEAISSFVSQWDGKTITMQMFLESSGGDEGLAASAARYTAQAQDYYENHARGGTVGFAGGGTVFGPGTSKSDSIYARLSAGEEVIQQPYAAQFRSELKQMNVGVSPAYSGAGVTNNWTINAPEGPSAEVIGRSAAAYATRKQRIRFA